MSWVLWVRKHALEFESDFRRFYGIGLNEAVDEMSGFEFWGLTYRVAAYDGLVARLVREASEEAKTNTDLGHDSLSGLIEYSST